MNNYLRKIANFVVYIVTLLGILAIIEKKIDPLILTVSIEFILLAGFVLLTISYISQLEKQIRGIKEKFIREKELNAIRKDVDVLKIILSKKR